MNTSPTPPMAKKVPQELAMHGDVRIDDYYWLNQREDQEVIDYLEAENAYKQSVMAPTEDLQTALFEELKGRIKENDQSVPYRLDNYYYYTKYVEGGEYPIFCRKAGSLEAEEEVLVDGNEMAKGHGYFNVRTMVSPDHNLLAVITDTVGRRIYQIQVKDLRTGEMLPDVIEAVTGNMSWANDNQTIFYGKQDEQTLRSYQIYRHTLGADAAQDALIFQEDDETYITYVMKSKSRQYLMIASFSTVATEFRVLDANLPQGDFKVVQERRRDHEYMVDHYGDHFYIRTNRDGAKNFMLMKTPVNAMAESNWETVIEHRDDVLLENMELFRDFLVLEERKEGLVELRVKRWDGTGEHYLDFGEPTYVAGVSTNPEFNTTLLRYNYQSLTTPSSTFDYNMETQEEELLKQQEILGGFDSDNYISERLYATATDGTKVPISLVYRKDQRAAGNNPMLVYGYGSYGYSMDPYFRASILSLLDRGFVFALAHIRGGEEMGRHWYEDGKLLNKMNTFTDFIDCTEHLLAEGYGDKDRTFAMGGSAGGLLMGAVINLRPDLYKGVIAAVPFVDVVTTMLDESIPLTTGEYDEWGNPNDKEYYDYIKSYSPYDNVTAQEYPHMLVTTGLHDSQVQYWEPAKWVAKLRELKTGDNLLLLHTNMEAGHGGASGRFRQYQETAMEYAFLLDLAGIRE